MGLPPRLPIPAVSKMHFNQPTYQCGQRRTSVLHVGMCWLLCLSVWRGPVPVIHEHTLELDSLVNNSQLAEHAIAYHAESLGHDDTGLHVHFILPDRCSDSLLMSSYVTAQIEHHAVDSLLNQDQQHRITLDLNAAQLRISHGDAIGVGKDLRFSSIARASFLQTRLYGAPALAVLCVCLC